MAPTPMERTEPVRAYATKLIEEIIFSADMLANARPLSRMTSSLMEIEKETSIKQIDELTGFLEGLRKKIVETDTTFIPF